MSLDLSQIKNIIFDLGGVILNIDHEASVQAFRNLGIPDFDRYFSKLNQSTLFVDLETGKITPQVFRERLKDLLPIEIEDVAIDRAWNAIIKDFPVAHIHLIEQLKTKFNTYLLSNTNAIHHQLFSQRLKDGFGYNDIGDLMVKAYYSHEIELHKPDPRIFQYVLEDAGLKAEETLFIDDSSQHVEAAQKVGLQVYHLKDNETITELF